MKTHAQRAEYHEEQRQEDGLYTGLHHLCQHNPISALIHSATGRVYLALVAHIGLLSWG